MFEIVFFIHVKKKTAKTKYLFRSKTKRNIKKQNTKHDKNKLLIYMEFRHTSTHTYTYVASILVYFRIYAFEIRNICLTIQMHITHTHTQPYTRTTLIFIYIYIHIFLYSCKCIEFIFLNVNKCVFWNDSVRNFRVGYEKTKTNTNKKKNK